MEPGSDTRQTPGENKRLPDLAETRSIQVGPARVGLKVQAPAGARLRVTVEAQGEDAASIQKEILTFGSPLTAADNVWQRIGAWLGTVSWEKVLFGLALGVYLLTRLVGLTDYPIYFFTDEAVQTVLAQDLVRDGMRGEDGLFLPTFFPNGRMYNLGISVYLQVLPYLMFGKSVVVTRGVSVLITTLAAVYVWLILKKVFKLPYAWLGVLLLSITPAWFLHSRTAFETALATAFFAGFLYYYLRYRMDTPRMLYPAVLMGALTFYTYSPARAIILAISALLLIVDFQYHRHHGEIVLKGLGLAILLAIPLIRFEVAHPDAAADHLAQLGSYWTEPLTFPEKLLRYAQEYVRAFSPKFWYLQKSESINGRHIMKDYGHLPRLCLPLLLLGVGFAVRQLKSAAHRTILLAALAVPSGAALVEIGITRVLAMVIPAAVLTSLGFSILVSWLKKRWRFPRWLLVLPAFAVLAGFNLWMLRDVLVNGPVWSTTYGLNGMQYGARQVFGEITIILEENPEEKILLSPNWANGADTVARFFFDDPLPFEIGSVDSFIRSYQSLEENTLLVMTPLEVDLARESGKFSDLEVERTLFYPNGQPGFYFMRLSYVEDVEEIFAAERAARQVLQEAEILLGNEAVEVRYSLPDMGKIEDVFDDDMRSLMRSYEANPLRVELDFQKPRTVRGLDARIGGEPGGLTLRLLDEQDQILFEEQKIIDEQSDPRTVSLAFEPVVGVSRVVVLVENLNNDEPAHVHLWELTLE